MCPKCGSLKYKVALVNGRTLEWKCLDCGFRMVPEQNLTSADAKTVELKEESGQKTVGKGKLS